MSAMEYLSRLFSIDVSQLTKEELNILEAELFARIHDELVKIFLTENNLLFFLNHIEMEKIMSEENLVRRIINDILSTEEYSVPGIACYTQIPQDVIYEIAHGYNNSPTLTLPRKVIELHRAVRPDLYKQIIEKIKVDVGLGKRVEAIDKTS